MMPWTTGARIPTTKRSVKSRRPPPRSSTGTTTTTTITITIITTIMRITRMTLVDEHVQQHSRMSCSGRCTGSAGRYGKARPSCMLDTMCSPSLLRASSVSSSPRRWRCSSKLSSTLPRPSSSQSRHGSDEGNPSSDEGSPTRSKGSSGCASTVNTRPSLVNGPWRSCEATMSASARSTVKRQSEGVSLRKQKARTDADRTCRKPLPWIV